MPITLVTGLPGHGKTLYSLFRWKAEAEKEGRPVFHNGINGLNIPGWQSWDSKRWRELPSGAIYILDEAWRDFPVRGRGEPPDHVGDLAVHRHLGIDIVLITQDPMQVDSFVRRLVDRHFHIVRKFGTHFATIHEYANGVKESVAKSRGESIRHEWRYPKEVFDWYTSSERHTVKRRIPARVWLFLSMPFILAVLVYACWYTSRPSYVSNQAQGRHAADAGPAGFSAVAMPGVGGSGGQSRQVLSPTEYANSYTPRIAGLPHTAPVYDDATRPVDAPYPAACISMPAKNRCSCYSQQATKLEMPKDLCEQIAAGGFFVAWRQQVVQAVPVAQPAPDLGPSPAIGIGSGSPAVTTASAAPAVPPDLGAPPRVRR